MSAVGDFTVRKGVLTAYKGNSLNVEIPEGVTCVGKDSFRWCTTVVWLTFPDSVTKIEDYAFSDCSNLIDAELSSSLQQIGKGAFSGCSCMTTVKIPKSVTIIETLAFEGCISLKKAVIPSSVIQIGKSAFQDYGRLKIYGKKGSAAESYAKENNIPFMITL